MSRWIVGIFLLLFGLMVIRSASDHSHTTHYTGDRSSEIDLLHAEQNFQRFGFLETRFMPIHMPLTDLHQEAKIPYYTHYPALPYWLIYVPYVFFGESEFAARLMVVLMSLTGLFFGLWVIKRVSELLQLDQAESRLAPWVLLVLALNPVFLCYGDTLYEQPMLVTLQWAALAWSIEYLYFDASIGWGVLIYFLNVWISFDWIVPLFVVFSYCIYRREGLKLNRLQHWFLMWGLGAGGAVALRLAHNAWALHGFKNMIEDFSSIAALQSAVSQRGESQYSALKHLVKLPMGLIWFTTLPALAMAIAGLRSLRARAKTVPGLGVFIILWILGSFSWQFLMRRESMVHGFTYIHPACGLLFLAALSVPLLWDQRRSFVISCVALQCVLGGMLIKSEIIEPFLVSSTRALAQNVCKADEEALLGRFVSTHTSISDLVQQSLTVSKSENNCDFKSRFSALVLGGYVTVVKFTLNWPAST